MLYENKKVIVCGMARSGISAAKLLASVGADVTLQDMKPMDVLIKLHDIEAYKKEGIKIFAGANPDDIIAVSYTHLKTVEFRRNTFV